MNKQKQRKQRVASGFYRRAGKRLFDIAASGLLLALFSPVLLLIALLVRWRLGSPVLFKQIRPGYRGRPFTLYKFRTMTDRRDSQGRLLPDDQRLTPLGRLLRATSLDELPELVNVLKGEMSLVGPRPLLMEYLPLYSSEQMRRHDVLPGITGWAQVNGRQNIRFSQRIEYDTWYVAHYSLGLDLKILLMTLLRVVRAEGVKHGQNVNDVDDLGLSTMLVPLNVSERETSNDRSA